MSYSARPRIPLPAKVVCIADVAISKTDWIWANRIPRGAITLVDGDPGLGKSTLTLDLAARISNGSTMPSSPEGGDPAAVILLNAEDHVASTVRTRLEAAGADLHRIHALVGMPEKNDPEAPVLLTSQHMARLKAEIVDRKAALVVVDPLMAYLPSNVDSHRDQDVRRVLRTLSAVAEQTRTAIVVVRHLRKGDGPALYRGGGSIGIAGAARSVLLVAADPADPSKRIVAVTKSNLGAIPTALRWRLVDAGGAARVDWLGAADGVNADDLVTTFRSRPNKNGDKDLADTVATVLREVLSAGPTATREVSAEVIAQTACSGATLRRAKEQLGVIARAERDDSGRTIQWIWALPHAQRTDEHLAEGGHLAVPVITKSPIANDCGPNAADQRPDAQRQLSTWTGPIALHAGAADEINGAQTDLFGALRAGKLADAAAVRDCADLGDETHE